MVCRYNSPILILLLLCRLITSDRIIAQIRPDFVLADTGRVVCIKLDPDKDLHATWFDYGEIYYGRYDSLGYPLTIPMKLPTNDFPNPYHRMAVNDDYIIVVWSEYFFTMNSHIFGGLFPIGSDTISSSIQFDEPYFDATRHRPDVEFLNDTTFIVVWSGQGLSTQTNTGIYGQLATVSLNLSGTNLLMSDQHGDSISHGFPRIAVHPEYEYFVVVWVQDRNDDHNIYGRLFDKNGEPQDSSFCVTQESDSYEAFYPRVCLKSDGNFIVSWSAYYPDTTSNVYLRQFHPNGSPAGPEVLVSDSPVYLAAVPDMSMNHHEEVVILWDRRANEGSPIMAQRFNSDLQRFGSNFGISVDTSNAPHFSPSVVLTNSKIYSAWHAYDPLGSYSSIWANILYFYDPQNGITEQPMTFPDKFVLNQNYPNPFNNYTIIDFKIAITSSIELKIFNIRGEDIRTLVRGKYFPGTYRYIWNGKDKLGSNVASGIYLIKLSGDNSSQSKKVLLIR